MPSRLADLLSAARLRVPMAALTLADAAYELAEGFVDSGSLQSRALHERIEEARPEDVVGLADRAFVMHYRTEAVKDLVVALGRSVKPVCRISTTTKPSARGWSFSSARRPGRPPGISGSWALRPDAVQAGAWTRCWRRRHRARS